MRFSSFEICAGAGGQALGLELAGFEHIALVEIDADACRTLKANRPHWNVLQSDVRRLQWDGAVELDLFAGGVPCPPFSKAGRQLGRDDKRDLFPEALRLVQQLRPRAVLLENVRGLLDKRFETYRAHVTERLVRLGYEVEWRLVNACDYGVPQLRPRTILIALKPVVSQHFHWPHADAARAPTVGSVLAEEMARNGWEGADAWSVRACRIAPTLVGGSRKHGGPDLGPTRARAEWMQLGVDGRGIANEPPSATFQGTPRLTLEMAAIIQGFPTNWKFVGGKTSVYRQIGNAFPPPVARALGESIAMALQASELESAAAA